MRSNLKANKAPPRRRVTDGTETAQLLWTSFVAVTVALVALLQTLHSPSKPASSVEQTQATVPLLLKAPSGATLKAEPSRSISATSEQPHFRFQQF